MEPIKPVNPYQSPSVDIMSAAPDADADFVDGGRSVPAGNGLSWIGAGWGIFTQSPPQAVDETAVEARLVKEIGFDPDVWIIEVEDREGRHFLDLAKA